MQSSEWILGLRGSNKKSVCAYTSPAMAFAVFLIVYLKRVDTAGSGKNVLEAV